MDILWLWKFWDLNSSIDLLEKKKNIPILGSLYIYIYIYAQFFIFVPRPWTCLNVYWRINFTEYQVCCERIQLFNIIENLAGTIVVSIPTWNHSSVDFPQYSFHFSKQFAKSSLGITLSCLQCFNDDFNFVKSYLLQGAKFGL